MSTQYETTIALNNIREAFREDEGVIGFGITISDDDYAIKALIKPEAKNVPNEYQGVKVVKDVLTSSPVAFAEVQEA